MTAPARATASLRPVSVAFVVFGTFWGGWAVAAADVERELGLSHRQFGLLLSVALAGAAVMNAIGGALTERAGSSRVLAGALATWAGLLLAGTATSADLLFSIVLVATVVVGGVIDVAMNVAATAALADTPGTLVRFHARFNGGAVIGAATTGILLGNNASWRWTWAVVAIAAAALVPVCARASLPASEAGEKTPFTGALAVLRRERLVMVAVAFAVAAMVEGGIELWSVLFVRTQFDSGLLVGATSATVGYAVATTARIVAGPAVGRRGADAGVALGAGAAAVGIVVLAAAPSPWLSGAGLVLASGGISMCWPLLLAHASADRTRPGVIVGSVTGVGYVGFVVGPTVVGWLAAAISLRAGLLMLAVAAMFVATAPALSRRQRRKVAFRS